MEEMEEMEIDDDKSSTVIQNGEDGGGKKKLNLNDFPFLKEESDKMEHHLRYAFESLDPAAARDFDEIFKKISVAEIRHHSKNLELLKETVELLMGGLKRSQLV